MNRSSTWQVMALVLGALVASGCATLRPAAPKPVTTALAPATRTDSAIYIRAELARQPRGVSGFRLLTRNTNALLSRLTLAERATTSIDLQYYIFKNDATGRLVAQRLLAAADRGVRVRLLLDDFSLDDQRALLDAFDSHPRIEVRLFNPFQTREPSLPSKIVQVLLEGSRLNRRMHNKSFIVDNKVAVIGGRNIGDDYFDASADSNFRDLDLVAIGPVVAEASRSFDQYWNSEAAVPVQEFPGAGDVHADLTEVRRRLATEARAFAESDYAQLMLDELPDGATADRRGAWFWGEAMLVADAPEKIEGRPLHHALLVAPTVARVIADARQEVKLVSPYFIPGDEDIARLVALASRGVKVSVLTNSLAATDEAAVYAKYAPLRRPLLAGGVELYELRPAPGAHLAEGEPGQSSGVALHAKAFVVDDRISFIGSMNQDPRSVVLNTEMGLVVDSPALAAAVADFFRSATLPASAYRLGLDGGTRESPGSGRVIWWTTDADGREHRVDHEPDTPARLRFKMRLMRMLPIKGLL